MAELQSARQVLAVQAEQLTIMTAALRDMVQTTAVLLDELRRFTDARRRK